MQEAVLSNRKTVWVAEHDSLDCEMLEVFIRYTNQMRWNFSTDLLGSGGTNANAFLHSRVDAHQSGLLTMLMNIDAADRMQALVESSYEDGSRSIPQKIAEFARGTVTTSLLRGAVDPRDMVFAPLALAAWLERRISAPGSPRTIQLPDYDESVEDVYKKFTLSSISATRDLEGICPNRPNLVGARRRDGLPSWVPDYSFPQGHGIYNEPKHKMYNACDQEEHQAALDPDSNTLLLLRGYHLDVVLQAEIADREKEAFDFYRLIKVSKFATEGEGRDSRDWFHEMKRVMTCEVPESEHAVSCASFFYKIADNMNLSAEVDGGGEDRSTLIAEAEKKNFELFFESCSQDLALSQVQILAEQLEPMTVRGYQGPFSPFESHQEAITDLCRDSSLIATSGGCLGLASDLTEPGDEIWLLPGLNVPAVLRPLDNGHFQIISDANIPGYMHGEAFTKGVLQHGESVPIVLE